ncbi:hypothetical protein N9M66_06415 [Litoreibacter sp.]|nr:hypothetical protein [Litoreibacter sp.]
MAHNIYFFGQNGLPDPTIWEASLSDLNSDYTIEIEEREDASPVYGEIMISGAELAQFELYNRSQTAAGFDGATGQSVFEDEVNLAKTQKSDGNPEATAALNRTNELLVLAIAETDRSDEQMARDIEPFLDWLHATSKGIHYVDGKGFFDATARL